jgi:putative heme-binding domain-containing protein
VAEKDPDVRLLALVAMARTAGPDMQGPWLEGLLGVPFAEAPRDRKLAQLRAAALGVMRLPVTPTRKMGVLDKFDRRFPTGDRQVDRELAHLLIRLDAPKMVERLLAMLDRAATQEEGIDIAMSLSAIADGWTTDERSKLLDWFDASAKLGGGRSCFGYIVSARNRFISAFPPADLQALDARVSQQLVAVAAPLEIKPRPFVREWKLDELVQLVEQNKQPCDFDAGRRMFSAAGCYNCHRVAGEGSMIGPDLTGVGRRFGVRDLMRAIVDPSQQISDQYQQTIYVSGGKSYVGRITNVMGKTVSISTDMLDPKKSVELDRRDIEEERPSKVSVMPAGLLNTLTNQEVLDLTAFLRSGGDSQSQFFAKQSGAAGQAAGGAASSTAAAASSSAGVFSPQSVAPSASAGGGP